MKVLLLGSGGREAALAASLTRSSDVELFALPGNPGIAEVATVLDGDPGDPARVTDVASEIQAGLVVVGPEGPLVGGVGDALRAKGVPVFGPNADAARVEGSKEHAKQLMDRAGIPTAAWHAFDTVDGAIAYLDELGPPYVVKADGLAAGKGVVVTSDRDQAVEAVRDCLIRGKFGESGTRVVIEEHLDGQEASLIAFTDGRTVLSCEPAQDYKRVGDGDQGPNTGGMGAYSPVPACPPELAREIEGMILEPMVAAIGESGTSFAGALYAGLALTDKGPRVIEFNARFGDPETQALLPRLRSNLAEVCLAAANGELQGARLDWSPQACVTVVAAAEGYPGPPRTGAVIEGIADAATLEGIDVFQAGTEEKDGRLIASGGRVLAISALGDTYGDARGKAYDALGRISFDGMHHRTDIAARAEQLEADR